MRFVRVLPRAALVVRLLLAAPPAAAIVPTIDDADGDGVADAVDACPETPAGDLVDAAGCSVCPCDQTRDGAAWSSRGDYVRCVIGEARRRVSEGEPRRRMRAAVRLARRSTCGNPALTRCCVYPDPNADTGTCCVMRPADCDALGDTVDAEDEGSGSCDPNPCGF